MILLTAHTDTVRELKVGYDRGKFVGLLDDFVGVIALFTALLSDKSLIEAERLGELKVYLNTMEEWCILDEPPDVSKSDTVIVIDVSNTKKFSIENISGFRDVELAELKSSLQWEGLDFVMRKFSGEPADRDDAWLWRGKCKVLSFIIPVKGPFHVYSTTDVEVVTQASHFLKRLICHLK